MAVKAPTFTMGIEEEYLLVDATTGELASEPPPAMREECQKAGEGQVSPEFMQSQIEIGTRVCKNITEAREDLARLRNLIRRKRDRDLLEQDKRDLSNIVESIEYVSSASLVFPWTT